MSGDPVREGYAKVKSKHLGTWNKRWLKLRPANSRQPHRLEKYQDEASANAGRDGTIYDLSEARYVDRMRANDKKRAVCIVLQNYDVVQFALGSDLEANNWLFDTQKLLFGKADVSSMFEVYLMQAPALRNASGECLLQVTEDSVRLLDIDNPRRVQLELPLTTIRRYSTERGILRLVTGRSSPIGEAELMFDTRETDDIYNSIQRATKELADHSQNKPTSTPPAKLAFVDQGSIDNPMSNHHHHQQQQQHAATSGSSKRGANANSSISGGTLHERNLPPLYEDSPPPYNAPDPPTTVKKVPRTKKISQEYVEPYQSNEYLEEPSKQRTKSDSTYSSKSVAVSNSYHCSASESGSHFDEDLPVYSRGSDDLYTADDDDHLYDGDRRQPSARCGNRPPPQPSAKNSSRYAKGSDTPYDLESDCHISQGPAAARDSTVGSQYSVPTKTSRHLQELQEEQQQDVYYDVQPPRRFERSESEKYHSSSTGVISGSSTERVQTACTNPTSTAAPHLPPRRNQAATSVRNSKQTGQQLVDREEDHKLDNALSKVVSADLQLRSSLKVDRFELQ